MNYFKVQNMERVDAKFRKYNYVLAEDFTIQLKCIKLSQVFENEFGRIDPTTNTITIYASYAWDGCSGRVWQGMKITRKEWMPKITPSSDYYNDTLVASLIHDFCYQFMGSIESIAIPPGIKSVRYQIDTEFYLILQRSKFILSWVYYKGVRWFGIIAYHLSYHDKR